MNRTNLWIDIGVFIAFLISSAPHLTGNLIHEWLGVALAAALITHILLHWKWITTTGLKFFRNLWHVSRLQFVVDLSIFVAFTLLFASGLAMSKNVMSTLGIQLAGGHAWKFIHSTASNIAVILTAVHLALNWNWIVCMFKRCIIQPLTSLFDSGKKPQPVPAELPREK